VLHGVKPIGNLCEVTGEPEVVRIEGSPPLGSRHVGDGAELTDWHQSSSSWNSFESNAGDSTLPDNGKKRTYRHFVMVGYRDGNGAPIGLELHHDMAAAPADFEKPVLFENAADLTA
jgi:hypothetical protein